VIGEKLAAVYSKLENGFYSILGFISCAVLILVSKVLGIFLKVEEDYYDR